MSNIHVYPINDLKEHNTESNNCDCNPTLERNEDNTAWVVIHNSWDRREYNEQDNKKFGKKVN